MVTADTWPANFAALQRGEGCPMCAGGEEENEFGVRVLAGHWADGYLGRYPVRPGYAYVVWHGRHVSEPTELSPEESAGFWSEVARVARTIQERYRPTKMNWLSLGNGVPHLHVHLVPRPLQDPRAGGPIEPEAFDRARTPAVDPAALRAEAAVLREMLGG